ncbi:unnamed protein product [Closterium sp. NIES-64]|nr:unnamed protein product [Closterium sp. NIES-64]
MAAAKVISDTLNACNGQAMRQLSDTVQLLIAAIHMAAGMWRPPPAPPLPATVPAPAQPPAIANDAGNLVNAALVDRELADAPEEDEGASPDDMQIMLCNMIMQAVPAQTRLSLHSCRLLKSRHLCLSAPNVRSTTMRVAEWT